MPRSVLIALTLAGALAGASRTALAGAWTPRAGSLYSRAALSTFRSTGDFDSSGHRVERPGGGDFTDRGAAWYVEYGIKDRLAFIGSLPFKRIGAGTGVRQTKNSGFGDVQTGLRLRLFQGAKVLSAQVDVKLPYAYDENDGMPLGNGQADYGLKLLFGKGVGNAYFGAEAGYRLRAGAPSDELVYLLEIGGRATRRLSFRAKLDGIKSRNNGDLGAHPNANPMLQNEFDAGKWQVTAGYGFSPRWQAEATWTEFLYGRNVGSGGSLEIALAYAH